ncbi:hypothetical protein EON62_06195 [archaeon]|nr:MAG: hypothetical protein EON62_06195 [archaeon]
MKSASGKPVDFHVPLLADSVKASREYRPLQAAGMTLSAEPGQRPVIPTHIRGLNTDARP